MRISSIRSRRSRTVQSAVLTGGSTVTSTVPGLSVVELRPATESEFLITIGTTGRPVAIAIRKAPFLNGPTDWVSSRVPSGATTMDRPLRAASSMGARAATAEVVSARSMNAASISLPSGPTSGLDSSSFLAIPVQLSLTSAATMKMSKLFLWLNRNTAGRCAVRFSSPVTFSVTPLSASTASGQNRVRKLTPTRLFLVSTPRLSAPAARGPSEPIAARLRTRPSGPPPPRLLNRRMGQPRRSATLVSRGPGLTGRGLPTRCIRARSSSPSA